MVNTRKLLKMARKWLMISAIRRKRISFPMKNAGDASSSGCSSAVAEKGHFVVYTADEKRYSFPIAYLNSYIFRELLRFSEEEFGLSNDGLITLPCDAVFMDYLISLMQCRATKNIEKALVAAAACTFSSSYAFHQQETRSHLLLCSF